MEGGRVVGEARGGGGRERREEKGFVHQNRKTIA